VEYAITWGGDPEDVCLSPSGVARVRDLDAMLMEAVADPRWVDGMKVLFDYTHVDMSGLKPVEMELRARRITQLAESIGHQRMAVVVEREADYKTARMIGFRLDSRVQFVAQVFMSLQEAREWLRTPPEHERGHVGPPR